MKSETDPITDDEWLLRRVPQDRFRINKVPMLSLRVFEPRTQGRDIDTDGLSLYRAACLNDPSDVLATVPEEKRAACGIVRVSVALLKHLQLTVLSKPDERVAGHVVIPELNAADYEANPASFMGIKVALATEASVDANILKHPQSS